MRRPIDRETTPSMCLPNDVCNDAHSLTWVWVGFLASLSPPSPFAACRRRTGGPYRKVVNCEFVRTFFFFFFFLLLFWRQRD